MKQIRLLLILIFLLAGVTSFAGEGEGGKTFLALCYHDIPLRVDLDNYGVDRASLVEQIEYLRNHGYHFIGTEDIRKAYQEEKPLPPKAVLLMFDDAYLSFYAFVHPLLELYGYPSVLGVETRWIENPPPDLKAPLMNWKQIEEVARSGLVEIASHSHALHHGVLYNSQGNKAPAAVSRIYDPAGGDYESEDAYRRRIYEDCLMSREVLREKLGLDVRVLVWPYGEYNRICVEEATAAGFELLFSVEDKPARADHPRALPRHMVVKNPEIGAFISFLKEMFNPPARARIVQADLDLIYDPDPVRQEKNLDKFIERLFNLKPNAVYLQAFSDPEGDGNICSVYFPNRVLPMKADLFNRVAHQLSIRGIQVYAWMPMLSIVLPDEEKNRRLRVRELRDGEIGLSRSWYRRLSPFSPEAREILTRLYEDLAIHANMAGVVFQDDGYLNDFEDFHPAGAAEYRKITGGDVTPYQELSPEQKKQWMKVKTRALNQLTERLKKAVLNCRPRARFVRTLYAPVLENPESEEWFAQNYQESLENYDQVMILAYPRLEKVGSPGRWLKKLVRIAGTYPGGLAKTVFKVQSYDWKKNRWIDSRTVNEWLRILVSAGARYVAYYPDNYIENKPDNRIIRDMISVEDFPFKRR